MRCHIGNIIEIATPSRRGVTCDHLDLIEIDGTYSLYKKKNFQEGDVRSPFPGAGVPKPARRFTVHERLNVAEGVLSPTTLNDYIGLAGRAYNLPVFGWGADAGYSATQRRVLWHPENWEPKES